jgi:hypothetical protein
MKRAKKLKVKTPVFTIKHKNTCKGSMMEGVTFKLTYVRREDMERSSAYLTELGVDHKVIEPKLAA